MKKLSLTLLSAFALHLPILANSSTLLDLAQFHLDSYETSYGQECIVNPFGLLVNGNAIAPASINGADEQHLTYDEGQTEALWAFKLGKGTGGAINVGWGFTNFKWEQNPFFNTTFFPFVNIGVSGYTDSLANWFWLGGINAQIQTNVGTKQLLTQRSRYSALLWGRYNFLKDTGVHLGMLVFSGTAKTNVWPIIGFDYEINENWDLNLIFPINLSLFYNINDCWSVSFAGRPFSARHRVASTEAATSSIFEYNNFGTELSLNYELPKLLASIYVGYSYGNSVKFENQYGDTMTYRHFKTAPYIGFNFLVGF